MLTTVAIEEAESPFVLALDLGSSSIRSLVFDRRGRGLEGVIARRRHDLRTDSTGAAEADAGQLFDLLCQCIDETLARLGARTSSIAGVTGCTFVGNIVGVDAIGQAMTPLFTYADTRSAPDAAMLRSALDEAAIHQRTGCRIHPSYLTAQLHWLRRTQPELWQRTARWLTLGEFIETRFFGEGGTSHSAASWSGLLDRRRLDWDEELLDTLHLTDERLPRRVDFAAPRLELLPVFSRRWPALAHIPWFPVIGDGAAANVGSGCVSAARVALTMGSTTALRTVVETAPQLPAALWCYRVDRRRSLPGGALTEGGNVYAWLQQTLRLTEPAIVEAALAQQEPDAHGLTILPFLSGERAPGWAGHARATIHGLSAATQPVEIVRAGLEAVAYRIALVFEQLERFLTGDAQVIASGGALQSSPAWLQIVADVLGRPVTLSAAEEASARGSALLALEALGELASLAHAPDLLGATIEPDPKRHDRYRQAIQRQQLLYKKLIFEDD
jgi:gluconokinase